MHCAAPGPSPELLKSLNPDPAQERSRRGGARHWRRWCGGAARTPPTPGPPPWPRWRPGCSPRTPPPAPPCPTQVRSCQCLQLLPAVQLGLLMPLPTHAHHKQRPQTARAKLNADESSIQQGPQRVIAHWDRCTICGYLTACRQGPAAGEGTAAGRRGGTQGATAAACPSQASKVSRYSAAAAALSLPLLLLHSVTVAGC